MSGNNFKKFSQLNNCNDDIPHTQNNITDNQTLNNNLDGDIELYGNLAKFPNNIKSSKAYSYLEDIKMSKNNIWYIMIEKQDNELQCIKYNYEQGVNLVEFVNELKHYYCDKYKGNDDVINALNKICVVGSDKYSVIQNIPMLEIDNKKLITIFAQHLIMLLNSFKNGGQM